MAIYVLDRPGKERDQILQWVTEVCGGEDPQPFLEFAQFQGQVLVAPPQLCLIRLGRDDVPGLQAAALVRQQNPDARIVFVADNSDYAIAAYELGADGYLLSPVKRDKLHRLLVHATSSSRELCGNLG